MAETINYDGVALTTVVRESVRIVEAAKVGDVGMGEMTIDDEAGALTPVGLKEVTVTQSSAPSGNRRVFSGRAADRKFRRGPYTSGAQREINVALLDANVKLGDHIVTGTDGKRSAETAGARLTWLLGTAYLDVDDNGFVVYPTTAMDANDYRGQTAGDVISDIALATGYNFFVYYDETAAAYSLFFVDSNTSSSYTTTTKISNVAADWDGTSVLAPLQDAELTRNPEKVASGVYVPYVRGTTYRTQASTATAFTSRDMTAPNANIRTLTKAQALGDRLLAENDEEDDTITCSVWVLPANVNDIRAGHLMQVKFSHLPGYDGYAYVRVLRRTVTQPQNTDFRYQVDLELSPVSASAFCGSYNATPSGTYYPLGGSGDTAAATNGVSPVYYLRPGLAFPSVPTAGFVGKWNFGVMGGGGTGTFDYAGDCAQNFLRLLFVGNGTVTFSMVTYGGTVDYFDVEVHKLASGVDTGTTVATRQPSGVDYAVTVSDRSSPNNCIWYVDINNFTAGASYAACGNKIGFAGAVWVQG